MADREPSSLPVLDAADGGAGLHDSGGADAPAVAERPAQGEFRRGPQDAQTARELRTLERVEAFVTRAGVNKMAAQELTAVMLDEDVRIREARGAADPRSRKRAAMKIRRETDARARALLNDEQYEAYRRMRRAETPWSGDGRVGRFGRNVSDR